MDEETGAHMGLVTLGPIATQNNARRLIMLHRIFEMIHVARNIVPDTRHVAHQANGLSAMRRDSYLPMSRTAGNPRWRVINCCKTRVIRRES